MGLDLEIDRLDFCRPLNGARLAVADFLEKPIEVSRAGGDDPEWGIRSLLASCLVMEPAKLSSSPFSTGIERGGCVSHALPFDGLFTPKCVYRVTGAACEMSNHESTNAGRMMLR